MAPFIEQLTARESLGILLVSFTSIFVTSFFVIWFQLWRMGNTLADLVRVFQRPDEQTARSLGAIGATGAKTPASVKAEEPKR